MKQKVLVVDDNRELLRLIRLSLKAAGFSVATASNGMDGLRKARSLSPDAVILDLVLPGMDGFVVCEALRNCPQTASLPVLILTGLNGQMARFAGMEAGATGFVTKPITAADLILRLNQLLQARETQSNN
jgi:DNA-binding response OmpR family regulator